MRTLAKRPIQVYLRPEQIEALRYLSRRRKVAVDAVSFAVMRQRGLTDAFAFDRHFLAAGFVLLPAPA
jgi:predicted nucleic acid-binding protein